jgi:hypothetical protein
MFLFEIFNHQFPCSIFSFFIVPHNSLFFTLILNEKKINNLFVQNGYRWTNMCSSYITYITYVTTVKRNRLYVTTRYNRVHSFGTSRYFLAVNKKTLYRYFADFPSDATDVRHRTCVSLSKLATHIYRNGWHFDQKTTGHWIFDRIDPGPSQARLRRTRDFRIGH